MPNGILVLKATDASQVKVLGIYPAGFACPPKLLDNIATNLDYGSFAPWGEVSTDAQVALCKLETTELGKEYLICLVTDGNVEMQSAAEFLNLIASKLALAENLGKLEENLPRLAPLVLDNLSAIETPQKKPEPVPSPKPEVQATGEPRICPFRMSLAKGKQACIREQCMAYFGDIGKAVMLLRQLFSALGQSEGKSQLPFDQLDQMLPKEGCFLIHGNPFRPTGLGTKGT